MYLDFAIPSLPTALCPPFAHQATRFKLLIENVSRLLLMESYWMTSVMMNWDVVDYDFVFWSAKPWLIFLHYTEEAELLLPRSSTMPPPQNALMTINTTQTQKRTLAWRKNQKNQDDDEMNHHQDGDDTEEAIMTTSFVDVCTSVKVPPFHYSISLKTLSS